MSKKTILRTAFAVLLFCGGPLLAGEKRSEAPTRSMAIPMRHSSITDPKVYIPLREQMTSMEIKFVDVQIMAAADEVDFKAIQKALAEMEASSKKIRQINPSEAIRDPLEKLTSQLQDLQRSAKRKDLTLLKGRLDGLFASCFKCHQTHAPLMEEKESKN